MQKNAQNLNPQKCWRRHDPPNSGAERSDALRIAQCLPRQTALIGMFRPIFSSSLEKLNKNERETITQVKPLNIGSNYYFGIMLTLEKLETETTSFEDKHRTNFLHYTFHFLKSFFESQFMNQNSATEWLHLFASKNSTIFWTTKIRLPRLGRFHIFFFVSETVTFFFDSSEKRGALMGCFWLDDAGLIFGDDRWRRNRFRCCNVF